jgi:DNA polymerase I
MKKIHAIQQQGYKLLHDGLIELARVEANGIRIDLGRLERTKAKLKEKLRTLREEMEQDKVWAMWRKRFGAKSNFTSHSQLATVLFGIMGFKVESETESGKPSTDTEALQKVDHPFVRKMARFLKYEKALGTFIKGIEREIVGDRIHPSYNLHLARSYRSSSQDPNFQNIPVRDPEISKIIRSLFIASSPSHCLVENDFKGIEVALSAAYHKDPVFVDYISTPGKDMHRDMAAQLYKLKPSEVSKEARYAAKNMFVFPQFYGDFYPRCAKALWEYIERGKLIGPAGESLYNHLKHKGILLLGACDSEIDPLEGSFEKHVKEVENDFWNRRFRQYGKWKRRFYADYLEKGYFDILTGFRVGGVFDRKQVCNYPIQGSAFHCLLATLIQVNRILRKEKMESMVIGQIHDSLVADVKETELKKYKRIVNWVVTVWLPRHYPFLAVSPQIECAVCPLGGNWFEKKEVENKDNDGGGEQGIVRESKP